MAALSSGEGLIWAVRDEIEKQEPIRDKKKTITGYQTVIEDKGVADKRLLVIEPEFASVLRVAGRDGNTLSTVYRQAWDSGLLRVLNKNSPVKATGAHISIIGHITRDELLMELSNNDKVNGFGNRNLWLCVQRSKFLPDGGDVDRLDLGPLISRRGGLFGSLTSRAEASERALVEPRQMLPDNCTGLHWKLILNWRREWDSNPR